MSRQPPGVVYKHITIPINIEINIVSPQHTAVPTAKTMPTLVAQHRADFSEDGVCKLLHPLGQLVTAQGKDNLCYAHNHARQRTGY